MTCSRCTGYRLAMDQEPREATEFVGSDLGYWWPECAECADEARRLSRLTGKGQLLFEEGREAS
jgi:hypothetical protein